MSTFKLVVKGEVLPGFEVERVKQHVAKLLKLESGSKQIAAVFSGRTLRLSGGMSREKAEKFQAAIEAAGLGCEVVAEEEVSTQDPAAAHLSATTPSVEPAQESPAMEAEGSTPDIGESAAASAVHADPQIDDTYNPYQQPQAELDVETDPDDFGLVEPKKLKAGSGWGWIKEGFYYFKQSPLVWIGAVVSCWLIIMVLSLIPFVSILMNVIMPVFTAGFMVAAYKQFRGEVFIFSDLFAGFKNNTGRLMAVGAVYLLGIIIAVLISGFMMFALIGNFQAQGANGVPPDPFMLSLIVLVMSALMLPLMAAYWFAPALVMFNDVSPVQAMRLSLKGCLRNWLPFTVYSLVAGVLMLLSSLTLFLGMLVLLPVGIASVFASYRQIYTNTEF